MIYEFNISLNGSHLFATHERSITDSGKATKVRDILLTKFPKSEGYEVSSSINPGISYGFPITSDLAVLADDIYGKLRANDL